MRTGSKIDIKQVESTIKLKIIKLNLFFLHFHTTSNHFTFKTHPWYIHTVNLKMRVRGSIIVVLAVFLWQKNYYSKKNHNY